MDGAGGQAAFALEQPLAADAVFGGRAIYGAAGTPRAPDLPLRAGRAAMDVLPRARRAARFGGDAPACPACGITR